MLLFKKDKDDEIKNHVPVDAVPGVSADESAVSDCVSGGEMEPVDRKSAAAGEK